MGKKVNDSKNETVISNKVTEISYVGNAKITTTVDDVIELKKAVANTRYINVVVMKLDLSSIDKTQDLLVPFINKIENKNVLAKNPKGSKSSKLVH